MLVIKKYTIGMGDRFSHQGKAQLSAVIAANREGIPVFPAWNKSFREHTIVGSVPDSLRAEADQAVAALGWKGDYYIDADHIGLETVDSFLAGSNFFTLDVADSVAKPASTAEIESFISFCKPITGDIVIPGIEKVFHIDTALLFKTASKFLLAAKQAGAIYRTIFERKGAEEFITEVSMDETDRPQTPIELFLILAMLAMEEVPVQTIAPKFTGRFNKGVDYTGNIAQFEQEFDEDLHVLAFAIQCFGLPASLKLSVHSGSDKFSLYPIISRLIQQHGCGLHVKTAGTTWLEEVIGLAESGGEGLDIAKAIYRGAFEHYDELTAPYATVIDIDPSKLPSPDGVDQWDSATYVETLRHIQDSPRYNVHFRQLIHVGFKIAAKMGAKYTNVLIENEEIISRNVQGNLLARHIRPIFGRSPQ